jgi:hypothetical protein
MSRQSKTVMYDLPTQDLQNTMLTSTSPRAARRFPGLPLDQESRMSADNEQEAEKVRWLRSRIVQTLNVPPMGIELF